MTRSGDQFLDPRQDALNDHVDAGRVGMHAIGLIESGIRGHAGEEERIKDDAMSRGKRRIDGVEGARIFLAHIGRRLHAGEQDGNMTGLELAQNGRERGPCPTVLSDVRIHNLSISGMKSTNAKSMF